MIELMVGLVLTSILIMIITRPLIDGLRTGNHSISSQTARADVNAALNRLRQDADATRSADRTQTNIRSTLAMQRALTMAPGAVRSEDPNNPVSIDVYDILSATPTVLEMRSDVDGTRPGTECVRYAVVSSGSFSVTRTVYPNANCSGAPLLGTPTQIIRSHAISRQTNKAPTLQYRLQCNASAATMWSTTGAPCAGRTTCDVFTASTVTGAARNAIVGIAFDVTAVVRRGDAAAESSSSVEAPIPTRNTTSYRRALGCE